MSEWAERPLGDLVDFKKGKKVDTSKEALEGYVDYLGAGAMRGASDGFALPRGGITASSDNVLMLWDGERSGLVGYGLKGIVSSTVAKLMVKNEMNPSFLYYFLSLNFEWIQNRRTGTGIPHVPKDLGRILRVRFPWEEDHQKKIATILETVDEAIEGTEAMIGKYEQVKAGMMQDLFTRGLTPDGKLRLPRHEAPDLYQESPIGWIPTDWEVQPASELCLKIIDCKNRTPPVTSDGFPVIRTSNVRHGRFIDVALNYTDQASYVVWTARGAPVVGDIVITREAPVGEVCLIPERHPNACLGQRMMLYRPNPVEVDQSYFLHVLQSQRVRNYLDLISGGSTVGHVKVGEIRELPIPKPTSFDEQIKIALHIERQAEYLEALRENLQKLRQQKSGLMHDLLTGTVPVTV